MSTPASAASRRYPDRPIIGVGAIVFKDDSVLLVQRGSQPAYGAWTVPGGAVELGETAREAAAREVAEECGIAVDITALVEVVDRIMRDESGQIEYHYVLIDFAARYVGGELHAASDALAARWVPLADIDQMPLPDPTTAVIRKAAAISGQP